MGRLWLLFVPLALGNLLMAMAEVLVSAGVTRMPDPTLSLAAFGVVLGTAVLIEGPVVMLLHAGNALVDGPRSFYRVRLFAGAVGLICGGAHALLAFTPLYDLFFAGLLGLPPQVVESARPAFALMVLWSPAIAWRRFHQGVLIHIGRTSAVGTGSVIRLTAIIAVLLAGAALDRFSGVVVGAAALSSSVVIEAAYSQWALMRQMHPFTSSDPDLRRSSRPLPGWTDLMRFYVPLATTTFILFMNRPVTSAALARSHDAELALAIWPVVMGTIMLFVGPAINLDQLVIPAALSRGQEERRRFSLLAGGVFSLLLLLTSVSGLMTVYLEQVIGLEPRLAGPALTALYLAVPLPALVGLITGFSGVLVKARRTMWITAAGIINLGLQTISLFALVIGGGVFGAFAAPVSRWIAGTGEIMVLRVGSRDLLGPEYDHAKEIAGPPS